MSNPNFSKSDEPSDLSIRLLTLNLRSDCENRGVSAKNYAHRSRVIRQQTELFARCKASTMLGMTAEEARAGHAVADQTQPASEETENADA